MLCLAGTAGAGDEGLSGSATFPSGGAGREALLFSFNFIVEANLLVSKWST